jgi:hypothetical protein
LHRALRLVVIGEVRGDDSKRPARRPDAGLDRQPTHGLGVRRRRLGQDVRGDIVDGQARQHHVAEAPPALRAVDRRPEQRAILGQRGGQQRRLVGAEAAVELGIADGHLLVADNVRRRAAAERQATPRDASQIDAAVNAETVLNVPGQDLHSGAPDQTATRPRSRL